MEEPVLNDTKVKKAAAKVEETEESKEAGNTADSEAASVDGYNHEQHRE